LARDASKPDSDVIKLENAKQPIEIDLPEADSARLYIKKQPPKNAPPWTSRLLKNPKNAIIAQQF
jgi:hypothetical protein